MKKTLCLVALVATLLTMCAFAQDSKVMPPISARQNVLRGSGQVLKFGPHTNTPPSYCSPCLFYGGDIDTNSSQANGLWNSVSNLGGTVVDGFVSVPFQIPSGQNWIIGGLFGNDLATVGSAASQTWSVSSGVSSGNGGTVLASGTGRVTATATGRVAFGLTEYTFMSKLPNSGRVHLSSGTYFMVAYPNCPNPSSCSGSIYYLSDSPDNPPTNAVGHEPGNDSFFTSTYFGYSYAPTWGSSGACGGVGCPRFSSGLIGGKSH